MYARAALLGDRAERCYAKAKWPLEPATVGVRVSVPSYLISTVVMDRLLDLTDDFVLSSGTVPIDISKGLVLLLYYRPKGNICYQRVEKMLGTP